MQNNSPTDTSTTLKRSFFAFLLILISVYALWLVIFWPGVLGQDSLGVLLEVTNPNHSSGTRNIPLLLVAFPMFIQFAGIFLFSTAAEYRYILPFFTIPLVLLPALQFRRIESIKV